MRFRILLGGLAIFATSACINEVDGGNAMGTLGSQAGASDDEALHTECTPQHTVRGIDVSVFQGDINWHAVANDGVKFAYIRVSDGLGFHDSKFDQNWSGAKNAGVLRGAYVFFEPGQSATAQADLLISKVGGHLGADDLPPVLDVEVTGGQGAGTIAAGVKAFMDRIHEKLHVNGMVYTGPFFWQDSVGNANFASHPLWIAHYGTSCPLVPGAWGNWTFHQYTDNVSVAGIPAGGVDGDLFRGTLDDLKKLTAGPDEPHACVTHHFHGAFCDDEGQADEKAHDQLKNELGVNYHCGDKAGSPAFCPNDKVDRSDAIFVLGKAAGMPTSGHPDAFHDDNNDPHENYLNAAHAYGIYNGSNGKVDPKGNVDRDMLAVILYRLYDLQDVQHDYFFDDDNDPNEHIHNAVAAAGLMTGYVVNGRQRRAFKAKDDATRSTLAVVAVRAHDKGLVPTWKIPDTCKSGHFNGAFCDDDGSSNESNNDRLKTELGIDFNCGKLGKATAFCGGREATRAEVAFVLLGAAQIPLANHPDAFKDDDNNKYEKYLNAAKAFGIFLGFGNGDVKPDDIATRDTLATVLDRTYALPTPTQDYFSDDNGDPDEALHNRVAEAGLFNGYDDGHGGRAFKGGNKADRNTLSMLAVRAKDNALVPKAWTP